MTSHPGLPEIEEVTGMMGLQVLKPRTSWENWDKLAILGLDYRYACELSVYKSHSFERLDYIVQRANEPKKKCPR